MFLKNLKIRNKLIFVFSITLCLFLIFFVYQLFTLNTLSKLQDEGAQRGKDGIYMAEHRSIGAEAYLVVADAIINQDKEETDKEWAEINTRAKEVFHELSKIVDTEQEEVKLDEAINIFQNISDLFEKQVYPLIFNQNSANLESNAEKIAQLDGQIDDLVVDFESRLSWILESLSNENIEADATFDEKIQNVIKVSSITMLVVFLISILFITILVNIIAKPLIKSVTFVKDVASGNLAANIIIEQNDEVGELINAMKNMVSTLKGTILNIQQGANNMLTVSSEINGASEQLSSNAQQMSANTQQMSQGATEQASSTEEISSSMEEMAANIQQNTENAQETEKISKRVSNDINDVFRKSQESIDHITKIAGKISIISDIAFQTNILALNAAVEAARAGEHGKGFAVVAAEVRKLAERSKVAADEIEELSQSSVSVTNEAGKMLEELIPHVQNTTRLVQEITAASIEQNSGANQVNNAIQQLNQITQQNAAASEEMATSAEELSSTAEELSNNSSGLAMQANLLQDAVAYFKTGKDTYHSATHNNLKEFQTPANYAQQKKSLSPENKQNSSAKKEAENHFGYVADKEDNEYERYP